MFKTALIAGALSAAWMLAAVAADLPSKGKGAGDAVAAEPEVEEPPPIPVFSWSGSYAGVHAGAEFGREALRLVQPAVAPAGFGTSPRGIIGGAHAGYNHALPRALGERDVVLGLEGDVDGADYGRAVTAFGRAFKAESDVKGSIRGRIGVAASRVLVFATGGLTFAEVATDTVDHAPGFPGGAVHATRVPIGYTLGAGVEYAFTNSYALRAEYRTSAYRSFGTPLDAAAAGSTGAVSRRETDNRLQAGVSYRFDTLAPPLE